MVITPIPVDIKADVSLYGDWKENVNVVNEWWDVNFQNKQSNCTQISKTSYTKKNIVGSNLVIIKNCAKYGYQLQWYALCCVTLNEWHKAHKMRHQEVNHLSKSKLISETVKK